jgi:iron complex transport system substrate-binding protein
VKATALIRRVLALVFLPALLGGCARPPAAPPTIPVSGAEFPLVLTDAQGVEVTVPARPERIVSASPAVTEILFALGAGDRVVAVTDRSNYPPEATERPKVGGFFTPSVEKVLGARPDLVIGQRGNPPDFVETLRRAGVPVFTVDPQTLDQILSTIQQVAQLIGDEAAGESLVGDMQRRLADIAARTEGIPEQKRPTAFLVLQVSPPWTAGSGTFQDDAIRAAGGRNIAADVSGFRAFSTESLVAGNPDFLLLSTMDGDPDRMKRDVLADPVLGRLSAVRQNHLVVLKADPLMRAGPRIVDAIEEMARAFYPQQSSHGR